MASRTNIIGKILQGEKALAFQVGLFPRLVSTRAKLAMLRLLNTRMEAAAEQSNHGGALLLEEKHN